MDQFWERVSKCHPKLKENVDKLSRSPLAVPSNQSSMMLFQGIDRNEVDFTPVFDMAAEYFTHLGIAFMNSGGPKSGRSTPHSVSDIVNMGTDELSTVAETAGSGVRKQAALKSLAFKRDGYSCALTGVRFNHAPGDKYSDPILAQVIPNSVLGKPDTLKCIASFAGNETRDLVIQHVNGIGNVVNLQRDAHAAYDGLKWGIEAQNVNGTVEYVYRRVPFVPHIGPTIIRLWDGDRIEFGLGTEGSRLGVGPLPLLCNLQLAVARVLKLSGAAGIIAQLMEDADDSDIPHNFPASGSFCDILDAKLLLNGTCV